MKPFFSLLNVCISNYYDSAGIFFSFSVMGSVVGFTVGGLLLDIYTHFDTIDTSTLVNTLCALVYTSISAFKVIVFGCSL